MVNIQQELAQIRHINGELNNNQRVKIALVVGRFNSFVVESLVDGAIDTLLRHGVQGKNITVVRVPGAWEIPLTVARLAQPKEAFDAIIALGAVIRGSTPHFDFVAGESAKGLGAISIKENIPVINAILTTDSIEQAIERSGTKAGNKGSEASLTALEMISALKHIDTMIDDIWKEAETFALNEMREKQRGYIKNYDEYEEEYQQSKREIHQGNAKNDTFDDDDMPF